jgi:hypothetical protein
MMEWLHTPSYWWSLVATIANIVVITAFVATLWFLWVGKNVHAWGATISFVLYLLFFFLEPPTNVKAYLNREVVHPQAAFRSVFFAVSLVLLIIKALKVKVR